MVFQLAYVSSSKGTVTPETLTQMLDQSRRNNADDDITGILIYHDGLFFQLLEGPKDSVRACYRRIDTDSRHGNTSLLMERETETRSYRDWSMGYISPEGLDREARGALRELKTLNDSEEMIGTDPAITTLVKTVLGERPR